MEQCPCNRNPLLLTAGKTAAVFADNRMQAVRHGRDILIQGAVPQGFLYLLRCKIPSQRNVIQNRGVKQEYILFDIADLPPKLLRGAIFDFPMAQADGTRVFRQAAQYQF